MKINEKLASHVAISHILANIWRKAAYSVMWRMWKYNRLQWLAAENQSESNNEMTVIERRRAAALLAKRRWRNGGWRKSQKVSAAWRSAAKYDWSKMKGGQWRRNHGALAASAGLDGNGWRWNVLILSSYRKWQSMFIKCNWLMAACRNGGWNEEAVWSGGVKEMHVNAMWNPAGICAIRQTGNENNACGVKSGPVVAQLWRPSVLRQPMKASMIFWRTMAKMRMKAMKKPESYNASSINVAKMTVICYYNEKYNLKKWQWK